MMHVFNGLLFFIFLSFSLSFCGRKAEPKSPSNLPSNQNQVKASSEPVETQLGEDERPYEVVTEAAVKKGEEEGRIEPPTVADFSNVENTDQGEKGQVIPTSSDGLYVGFPIKNLNEGFLFGGVVTKVSKADSETLGRLKLMDIPPIHARPLISKDEEGQFYMALMGCVNNCGETNDQVPLVSIPIVGISQQKGLIYLDISAVGKGLSFLKITGLDKYVKYQVVSTKATEVDYSDSTLLFDIEGTLKKLEEADDEVVTVTTRWYFKQESGFASFFERRSGASGVGFFMTERRSEDLITRFALTSYSGGAPVRYYLKDVPAEFLPHFKAAFDLWNTTFEAIVGKELIEYVVVDQESDLYDYLVTGDPRFNIIEWDLKNLAPYGGLGPSNANQATGEIFSANVLVQGPKIVELYSKWFEVGERARQLREEGRQDEAERLLAETAKSLEKAAHGEADGTWSVKLGDHVEGRIPSQMPELQDPIARRMGFYKIPENVSYDEYMEGYFKELVGHELGHNLGLRHNFKGNLLHDEAQDVMSSSIMEYLSAPYRYKAHIGEYDQMAIAYGYAGKSPTRTDIFCTDEDVPSLENPNLSAECSRNDATSDPFNNLLGILDRAVDLLVLPGRSDSPSWTVDEMSRHLDGSLEALGMYITSAERWSPTWMAWGDRPSGAEMIQLYVADALTSRLCGAALDAHVEAKPEGDARQRTQINVADLRAKFAEVGTKLDTSLMGCSAEQ